MPDRHKHTPISVRFPEDLRDRLLLHASAAERPVRSVIVQAVAEYLARQEPPNDSQ